MDRIEYGRHHIDVPTSWDDLTSRQLEALAGLSARGLPAQVLRVWMTMCVTGLRVAGRSPAGCYRLTRGMRSVTLTAREFTTLAHTQSYLLEESGEGYAIASRRLRQPYRRIGRLRSPGDGLERLTYQQFMYAQFY